MLKELLDEVLNKSKKVDLRIVKNATEEEQLAVIEDMSVDRKYIKNPIEKVQLAATKK